MPLSTEFYSFHCPHCDEWTMHEVSSSSHERDGSQDWWRCMVCGWEYSGLTGKYHPPRIQDAD